MGDWVIGALINLLGSIFINFGTNLLKSAHDERNSRPKMKPIIYFQAWRVVVSGAIGSCSVLFAKSLSNMLRLSMSSSGGYLALHSGFTYSMLFMFLSTGGFWMSRLNEGLSQFDAILIVPMFQIAWTFFSICTGFVYFEEYKVFDALRTAMFVLGMISVFVGIYLLAPEDDESSKGGEVLKDDSLLVSNLWQDVKRLFMPSDQIKDTEIIWTRYADENC